MKDENGMEHETQTFKPGVTTYKVSGFKFSLSNIPTHEEFLHNVAHFLSQGVRIEAVKYIRKVTKLGLHDAKNLMDMVTNCGWSYKKDSDQE